MSKATDKIIAYGFHGCGQNRNLFDRLLRGLKAEKKGWEWHLRNGFFTLDQGFSWYDEVKNHTDSATVYGSPKPHPSMEDMYDNLCVIAAEQQKPVVLVGFSQGAMLACDMAFRYRNDKKNPIIGVVAIAPPFFQTDLVEEVCQVPLILVTSAQDQLVPAQESAKWTRHFSEVHHFQSEKGHKVHFPKALRDVIFGTVK